MLAGFVGRDNMPNLTLLVVLTVREGTELEMRDAFASIVAPSRLDSGNLRYELFADQAEPRRFIFLEVWADEASQLRHDQESSHILDFKKNLWDKVENAEVYRLNGVA